jgi:hypothetical protein
MWVSAIQPLAIAPIHQKLMELLVMMPMHALEQIHAKLEVV